MSFDHLTIEDGLSQSSIHCILQDRSGFLWFGTQDGLNRFDGYELRIYRSRAEDPSSLPHSWVRGMVEDDHGDLWLATHGGLAVWRRATDKFERLHDDSDSGGLTSDHLATVFRDSEGLLWIASKDSGLDLFDPQTERVQHFRRDLHDPTSLADDRVRAVYEDQLGNIWIATMGGLDLFDRSRGIFFHHRHDPSDDRTLSDDRVLTVTEDSTGRLWVGTLKGLNVFDRVGQGFERYLGANEASSGSGGEIVRAITEDQESRIWVGTDEGLRLWRPETRSFAYYRHTPENPASLGDDNVLSIFQDRGGILWVGTLDSGLSRWNPKSWVFEQYRVASGRGSASARRSVYGLAEDARGRLWIGSLDAGLERLDRTTGEVESFRHDPERPESLSEDRVTSLLVDRAGVLWVGTMAGGLNRLDAGSRSFDHLAVGGQSRQKGSGAVRAIYEDHRQRLWVGTHGGGLDLVDRSTLEIRNFSHDPDMPASLGDDRVAAFVADPETDRLWIGTEGGLSLLEGDQSTFHTYRHDRLRQDSLISNSVVSLEVDPSGRLWLGTLGSGLGELVDMGGPDRGAVFRHYSEQDGLPNSNVWGIRADDRGMLWISTNKGLARFDPETCHFRRYNKSHGLQSEEFNYGAHFESESGELFFGSLDGVNAFHPEEMSDHSYQVPLVLTSFSKLNEPRDLGSVIEGVKELSVGYRDYVFSFEFALLDFAAPKENRYAFKLEGLGEEWIDLGSTRRVQFTNLDPGDYVLRVKGADSEGVWSDSQVRLGLKVEAPPWQRPWAWMLYAMVAVIGLVQLRRKRQRRGIREIELQRAREATAAVEGLKESFLANMSHEVRTPMTGVVGMVSLLLEIENDAQKRRYLETIRVSSEAMLALINNMLDFSRLEARKLVIQDQPFDLREVVEEALAGVSREAAEKGLELVCWIEEGVPDLLAGDGPRTRQVLAQLLGNAVKFTASGQVLVEVAAQEVDGGKTRCHFKVEDSGEGVSAELAKDLFRPFTQGDTSMTRRHGGAGMGLALSHRLIDRMGGEIWFENREAGGATFHFALTGSSAPGVDRGFLFEQQGELIGKRALGIVSNPILAEVLERQLTVWGMSTRFVTSPAMGQSLIRSDPTFDCVLVEGEAQPTGGESAGQFENLPALVLLSAAELGARSFRFSLDRHPIRAVRLLESMRSMLSARPRLVSLTGLHSGNGTMPRQMSVLVTEDNEPTARVLGLLLQNLGHRVEVARDGNEALRACHQKSFDIVLMDLQMPELDGLEVSRRLRQELDPDRQQPWIVAVTAHGADGIRERCLEAGMNDYLSKPVQLRPLQAALLRAANALREPLPEQPPEVSGRRGTVALGR